MKRQDETIALLQNKSHGIAPGKHTPVDYANVHKMLPTIQCRTVLTILAFTGLINVYTMRMNLGVAIVAMVKPRPPKNVTVEEICPVPDQSNETHSAEQEGEFDWDENTQSIVLGCFFYAYMITNFVGGRVSEVVGVKLTYGVGILSTSVLTMLTPIVARWHYAALIVLRVLEGLMEGVTFPALHCMLGRWYPLKERAFVYSIIHAGSTVGSVISLFLSGVLCDSTFLGGWPSAFYVFGFAGLLWVACWFLLMHEFPHSHPRISKAELDTIVEGMEADVASKDKPVPWIAILTSIPVYTCAISSFGKNWIQNCLQINIPGYLKNILNYDIQKSGILSSIPLFIEVGLTIFAGYVSDFILKKKLLSVPVTRKLFNTLGLAIGAACLVCIPSVECNRDVIITLLAIAGGVGGLCTVGSLVAIVDMSPIYAGTIMGIVNSIGQLSGFLAPLTVGHLTNNKQTAQQWFTIFYISAAISLISAVIFLLFGKATLQPWSKDHPKKSEKESGKVTLTAIIKRN